MPQVAHKKVSDSRVELTLTVSPERTQEIHDDVLKQLQKESQLPGFRKGQKVPQALLVQSCGGEKAFKGEVIQALIERSAGKALEEWQGIAIDDSDRLESDAKELLASLDMNKPFIFRISFDVMSELKWLKAFQDLKVGPCMFWSFRTLFWGLRLKCMRREMKRPMLTMSSSTSELSSSRKACSEL